MAARKAETKTPGGSVSEARAKSAVVKLETQPKVASSDQSSEAITKQITYLMSTITNQNANTNGQNGPRCNSGGGKFTNTKAQWPKKDRKDMFWGDVELPDMGGESAQHLEKVIISLSYWSTEI